MTFVAGARFLFKDNVLPFFTEIIANARSEIIRAVKSYEDQDVYIRHGH